VSHSFMFFKRHYTTLAIQMLVSKAGMDFTS
jgi:hypothetical protein